MHKIAAATMILLMIGIGIATIIVGSVLVSELAQTLTNCHSICFYSGHDDIEKYCLCN